MRTKLDLLDWCAGAAEEFGDPSVPVGQVFARFQQTLNPGDEDLTVSFDRDHLIFNVLGANMPLHVDVDGAKVHEGGTLAAFGVEMVTAGVWYLTPSLNIPGLMHVFVTVFDVPTPAPWERRIITL